MKNELARFALGGLLLVAGLSAEAILPPIEGVGAPILLASCAIVAWRWPLAAALPFAVITAVAEDALAGLPVFSSPIFFLFVVVAARRFSLQFVGSLMLFPLYLLWLMVWARAVEVGAFLQFVWSFPIGLVTVGAVKWFYGAMERRAALEE